MLGIHVILAEPWLLMLKSMHVTQSGLEINVYRKGNLVKSIIALTKLTVRVSQNIIYIKLTLLKTKMLLNIIMKNIFITLT